MKKILMLSLFIFFLNVADVNGMQHVNSEMYNFKLLYEEQKNTNEKLINMIYTTLAVTVTLIVLFLGTSFFYHSRINKKEIESEINTLRGKTNQIINSQLEEAKEDFEKQIKNQLEMDSKRYSTKTEGDITSIKSKLDSYGKEKKYIHSLIDELNGLYWDEKKIYSNASRFYAKSIRNRLNSNVPSIDFLLDNLISSLERATTIHVYDHAIYFEVLSMLGEEYNATKSKIESLIESK